jgi:hypothetical protein
MWVVLSTRMDLEWFLANLYILGRKERKSINESL